MAKPSDRSPERKLQVVLSVLRGELSVKKAAQRAGVAEQTVHNWKRALWRRAARVWPKAFTELVEVPRRTYHARLARLHCGGAPKGP